jgi:thymidylate synthase
MAEQAMRECNDLKKKAIDEGNHEEQAYLDLVKKVVEEGRWSENRTGVRTKYIRGAILRFDVSKGFPLLTSRKMFTRGIFEELMWFLRGQTDSKILEAKGVNIWKGNTSREYIDKMAEKLKQRASTMESAGDLAKFSEKMRLSVLSDKVAARREGDAGPVYGFQWRHFGAEYEGPYADYRGKGFDQIERVIRQIREEPNSRQILLTAYNPAAVDECVLPPCHSVARFEVREGLLDCTLYQRSADLGLGVGFNIASYAFLMHILAKQTGLKPGEFVWMGDNVHVYENHIEPMAIVCERKPYPFPQIKFRNQRLHVEHYEWSDVEIKNYHYHDSVFMPMAV